MGMDKMIKTRQQLAAEGWKIASVTGGTHLKRTLEMYRELEIEVYLEKAKPEECEGCTNALWKTTKLFIESTPDRILYDVNPVGYIRNFPLYRARMGNLSFPSLF